MKFIPLLIALFLPITLHAAEKNVSAMDCLNALPAKYRPGILKLAADDAAPNPDTWYVVAEVDGYSGDIHKITVTGGQIVSDKRGLGLREIFTSPTPINLSKVVIDSDDVFKIAQRYARANGKKIASVSFVLEQKGKTATPIWSVWCYGADGTRFGLMQLLATDGTVITNNAFPKNP